MVTASINLAMNNLDCVPAVVPKVRRPLNVFFCNSKFQAGTENIVLIPFVNRSSADHLALASLRTNASVLIFKQRYFLATPFVS